MVDDSRCDIMISSTKSINVEFLNLIRYSSLAIFLVIPSMILNLLGEK